MIIDLRMCVCVTQGATRNMHFLSNTARPSIITYGLLDDLPMGLLPTSCLGALSLNKRVVVVVHWRCCEDDDVKAKVGVASQVTAATVVVAETIFMVAGN